MASSFSSSCLLRVSYHSEWQNPKLVSQGKTEAQETKSNSQLLLGNVCREMNNSVAHSIFKQG